MIPYINRTCDVVLSDLLDHKDIRVREIQSQFDNYTELLEAVVFMAPGRFRLTCKSSRKMENLEHTGFHIRGHPVEFVPVTKFKWVNISRLSYGVPDTDISKLLAAYGQIKTVRSEQYNSLYTGVRHVLMDLSADIPARLRIAGHWCFVHYKGQKKLCFSCGSEVIPSVLARLVRFALLHRMFHPLVTLWSRLLFRALLFLWWLLLILARPLLLLLMLVPPITIQLRHPPLFSPCGSLPGIWLPLPPIRLS